MNAPIRISTLPHDELQTRVYGSLARVLEHAPIENRPRIFFMMCRNAAQEAAIARQQAVDDLWSVADGIGLVRLLGATAVQSVLADAFGGIA